MPINGLELVRESIQQWCNAHNIYVSIICDTVGLQGVKIYERNKANLKSLLENLSNIIKDNKIFVEIERVRGGHLLAFSLEALSESDLSSLVKLLEEENTMSFKDKIANAFIKPIIYSSNTVPGADNIKLSIEETARKIAEDSFKDATEGGTRANQTSLQRGRRSFEQRISGVHKKHKNRVKNNRFGDNLSEALEGMATPTDEQPNELFKKFGKALTVLGNEMGIGPLQDHLKQQGINYKKSQDGQSIIMYIINAQTNAPQPIARISSETLAKPNEFQNALLNMIDFSQGKAPGAFKQEQEQLRSQEKVVRDISQALNPDNNSASNISAQLAQPATTQAATQAAAPKV